ncbi:MAG: hypothetical protein JO149_08730, partial [Gammaproteobacteria bacterium]|nr:hypothetical protein [Gammaproteobacteria bacterium]
PPVADYVVSVIAALQKKNLLLQSSLKAAVIGVGHVGHLVVECLKLLGFAVILCDPLRAQQEDNFLSTPIDVLENLDLITLHVPLTKTGDHPTFHFIDKTFLQKQKPGCVLINASRGAVINSHELLEHGQHLHWCFDVWEHEPNIYNTILEQSLLATPHIAGYSVQSKIRGMDKIYRLACERHLISPQAITPILMPTQQLMFTENEYTWQDLILSIFNPLMIDSLMRTTLLPEENHGRLFDELRNQFNARHEFHYTYLSAPFVSARDKALLVGLGIQLR